MSDHQDDLNESTCGNHSYGDKSTISNQHPNVYRYESNPSAYPSPNTNFPPSESLQQAQLQNVLTDSKVLNEEGLLGKIGAYFDLVEKFENAQARNIEYVDEMNRMKIAHETQTKQLQAEIARWKRDSEELVATRQRNCELERDNSKLTTELTLAVCRSQSELSRLKKENELKETLENQNRTLENQIRTLENQIVSLKLDLANSRGMEDRHALELRQVSGRLSDLRKWKSDRTLGTGTGTGTRTRSGEESSSQASNRGRQLFRRVSFRRRASDSAVDMRYELSSAARSSSLPPRAKCGPEHNNTIMNLLS